MKRTTSMTIGALVVAVAAGAATASAFAQDQGKPDIRGPGPGMHMRQDGPRGFFLHRDRGPGDMRFELRGGQMGGQMGGKRGGVLALVCAPEGADRLEHLLLSISQRVDPTTEQQPLYDAFKSAALTAQTDFSDACTEARPQQTAEATPADLADRMKTRLAIEKAHVEAMTNVIPTFEAFYDSLTDEQKLSLEPRRRHHMEGQRPDAPRAPGTPAPSMDQPQDG
jgi:hypothetical protein